MAYVGQQFDPGESVPTSGIYRCTGCNNTTNFSTNVKGHVFPPSHCPGKKWQLVQETPHAR
ncbi:MAG TPA: hypothetical protein VKZ53_02600 [Candidatus Angelobacter sp.]|nr:hypothetical protein [Candidatus Angelobacter sp.]